MKKNKFVIVILISISILLAVLCQCVYFQEIRRIEKVRFIFSAKDGITDQVSLYKVDNVYYAFLPSYADLSTTTISISAGYKVYINEQEYHSTTTCNSLSFDQEYTITIKNPLNISIVRETFIMKQAKNTPTLSLHLSNGTLADIHADQDVSKTGTALLVTENRSINYNGSFKSIHGRGNSTWTQVKKSYSLNFKSPTDLLGLGAGTGWVLLANSIDKSSLRNKIVYDMAVDIGLPYACNATYVDLYVDDEYQGLYLLSERIDVETNRVNINRLQKNTQALNHIELSNYSQIEQITNGKIQRGYNITRNPSDITGGYLLQIEHHSNRILRKESLFQTESLSFSLTYPKYASLEQVSYISTYMNNLEQQLKVGDLSGIDIDSFARLYFLQELFANRDNCSVFFYKDSDSIDPKLYAGPIWDLDLSMGNSFTSSNNTPDQLCQNCDNWFNYLLECEEFKTRVHQLYWDEFKPNMNSYISEKLEELETQIKFSFIMDNLRWKGLESEHNNWAETSQMHYVTLDEYAEDIVSFMNARCNFLDKIWGDQSGYALISFQSEEIGKYKTSFYVQIGSSLQKIPNPQSSKTIGYEFQGWFDSDGNPYNPESTITADNTYIAKWEKIEVVDENPSKPTKSWITKEIFMISIFGAILLGFVTVDLSRSIKNKRYKNDE